MAEMTASSDITAIVFFDFPTGRTIDVVRSLNAGIHVLCYGAFASSLSDARDMATAAARPGAVSCVAKPMMRGPYDRAIQKFLRSGRLGRITVMDVIQTSPANVHGGSFRPFELVKYIGGNALNIWEYADTLNAWLSPYESLYAVGAAPLGDQKYDAGLRRSDVAPQILMISGVLANGAIAVEYHGGISRLKNNHDLLTVYGSLGTFRYHFGNHRAFFAEAGEDFVAMGDDILTRDPQEIDPAQEFFDIITRKATPRDGLSLRPFEEALRIMQKVEAIRHSYLYNRPFDLSEL
ncbi:hypothetical protein GXW71_06510 [Roseomonas hellenica]|uniref:Gfo/Idh/MocA-like oxidoreductase N-terminal domain-containing protein n=1 Tax=Plastoroseomonas hellenica TaxID=2687306 RepID=A0ABS5EVL2_9PROT|nr:hypothetical protein [Plastoroseomonas hellenica]MBR0664005.1 hypothetical protein [Plastoroseomonas hellenica]